MADHFVECYAGRHYPERPKAFRWEGERLEIEETEHAWRTQGKERSNPILYHFRVRTARGCFHLAYNTAQDEWEATRTECGSERGSE